MYYRQGLIYKINNIFFYLFIFFLGVNSVNAQNYGDKQYYLIDSLNLDELSENDRVLVDSSMVIYHDAKDDLSRIKAIEILSENMMHDDWSKYNLLIKQIAEEVLPAISSDSLELRKELLISLAGAINNIGYIYMNQGDITLALDYYNKCLDIFHELDYKEGAASNYNNIGLCFEKLGNIPGALENYQKSLKIKEEFDDKRGIATTLNNIASIYYDQGDVDKALEYDFRSLKIREEIEDKYGIGYSLNNIGTVYSAQAKNSEALEFLYKSLNVREEIGDLNGMATTLINIGNVYLNKGDIIKSLGYYNKSLAINKQNQDKQGISYSMFNIAKILYIQKRYGESKKYAKESYSIAVSIGYPEDIKNAANLLYQIYKKDKKGMDALEMFELFIVMRDSVSNEANKKLAIKQSLQYDFEKKEALINLEAEKREEAKNLEIEKNKSIATAERKRKNSIIIAIAIGLVVVIIFLAFLYRRFKITQKQKNIITKQKKIVEEQRTIVEQKIQETTDSISYAKLIQQAVLPPEDELKSCFSDAFIFFKPKDIVSGDFYWFHPYGNQFLLSLADCTGHGVPGAFMSMIGINLLDKIVFERKTSEPNKVLKALGEQLYSRLKKSKDDSINDGMDIAFCLFDLPKKKLFFAGTHNPIYIIRNKELIEIKGDRIHLGNKYEKEDVMVSQHEFNLESGDAIYLFSDGFPDQKGGVKGKKFYYKPFRELLIKNSMLPCCEQRDVLAKTFLDWKGEIEQFDDVCVIGVKI